MRFEEERPIRLEREETESKCDDVAWSFVSRERKEGTESGRDFIIERYYRLAVDRDIEGLSGGRPVKRKKTEGASVEVRVRAFDEQKRWKERTSRTTRTSLDP